MNEIIQTILTAILIAAIPVITSEFVKFLKAQVQGIKEKTKQEKLNKYIERASKVITDVVEAISQTTVETLKKQGAFDKEKQKEAFNKAKTEILEILTEESKEALKEAYGDLDIWLQSQIEANVKRTKQEG